MLAQPPVAPATGRRSSMRLARDHYVRLDRNDYSVHPSAIGRRVEVVADLAWVQVLCDGKVVADHARVWAAHQSLSDPCHVEAGRIMRGQRLDVVRPVQDGDIEQRRLADCDVALGIDLGAGAA